VIHVCGVFVHAAQYTQYSSSV